MKIGILIFIAANILFHNKLFAQCCAPGNPVSGSEYNGILATKTLRTVTFFRHSTSDTYFEKAEKSELQGTQAGYDYLGEVVTYGLAKRLAIEVELGYYFNKYQESDVLGKFKTYGFNNAVISAKYAVVKTPNNLEITIGTGIKIPLSTKTFYDMYGMPFGQDIHPSTGAFGFTGQVYIYKGFLKNWRTVLHQRYDHNGYNKEDYRFGDSFITSLFLSRSFRKDWTATIQLRNEYRHEDYQGSIFYLSTGGNIMFLSPQISKSFKNRLTLAVSGDYPILRNYNGIQLGPKYSIGISLVKDFCL